MASSESATAVNLNLETPSVCACLSDLSDLFPKSLPFILLFKPSIAIWKSLLNLLPNDRQGLKLGLKPELCCLTNEL